MIRKIALIALLSSSLFADYKLETNVLACMYEEIKPAELLKEKDLVNKEHINNLLNSAMHEKKYFYKALVLDYYYDNSNAKDLYERAYKNATYKKKPEIGIYYSFYLQKKGFVKKGIKVLREVEIFSGKNTQIPKKIAATYQIFNLKQDVKIKAYFNRHKIDQNLIIEEVKSCGL